MAGRVFTIASLLFLIIITGALLLVPQKVVASPPAQEPALNCRNILLNSDFEKPDYAWGITLTPKHARYVDRPDGQGKGMFLGNEDPSSDVFSFSSIWQDFTVPPQAVKAILEFSYLLKSSEQGGVDEFKVVLLDPWNNSVLKVLWRTRGAPRDINETPYGTEYHQVIELPLELLRNKPTRLYFTVVNDGNGEPTAVILDNVLLKVCLPATPTPTPVPPTPTFTPVPPTPTPTGPTPTPIVPTPTVTPGRGARALTAPSKPASRGPFGIPSLPIAIIIAGIVLLSVVLAVLVLFLKPKGGGGSKGGSQVSDTGETGGTP